MSTTINLKNVVSEWGCSNFHSIIKSELEQLDIDQLQLQKGLSFSNFALNTDVKIIILNSTIKDKIISIKAGVFYTGIVAGCNCSDDPSPIDKQNEYCEILVSINNESGNTTIDLVTG